MQVANGVITLCLLLLVIYRTVAHFLRPPVGFPTLCKVVLLNCPSPRCGYVH